MGNYLNSGTCSDVYMREIISPYFVDKSMLLEELIPRIGTSTNYVCITRPPADRMGFVRVTSDRRPADQDCV